MDKPIKMLELHYPMIQFLIINNNPQQKPKKAHCNHINLSTNRSAFQEAAKSPNACCTIRRNEVQITE